MKEQQLKAFLCKKHNAVIIAYNRGQAVKLLARDLKCELSKQDAVLGIDLSTPHVYRPDQMFDFKCVSCSKYANTRDSRGRAVCGEHK